MPTLEEIGHLPAGGKFFGRKGIKELPNMFWEDETVEGDVTGSYDSLAQAFSSRRTSA